MCKPPVNHVAKAGIAEPEVIIGDPAAACQQLKGELHRLQSKVALDRLKIRLAHLCSVLENLNHGFAFEFIFVKCALEIRVLFDSCSKSNGIFHRQLCARTNRKVCRVYSIAKQDYILVVPVTGFQRGETRSEEHTSELQSHS